MNLIFDLGGVLMMHNMPACLAAFRSLMGEEGMQCGLGLLPNGEGLANSLMNQYEAGLVSEEEFISAVLCHSHRNVTSQQVIDAWNAMHAGIPEGYLDRVKHLGEQGHHLFVLSNNNSLHWKHILASYDMSFFEHVFLSHEIHASKPDPCIYQFVQNYLRQHYLADLPTVFVDDIAVNRAGGERLGWKTFSSLDEVESYLLVHL